MLKRIKKSDDDPTKIKTKVGISWSDSDHMNDSNISFSGLLALDEVRQVNVSVNSNGSELRIGGSWLFHIPVLRSDADAHEKDL